MQVRIAFTGEPTHTHWFCRLQHLVFASFVQSLAWVQSRSVSGPAHDAMEMLVWH